MKIKDNNSDYMISISDIMSGLMFLFIIMLAIFVVDFMNASIKHEQKIKQLTSVLNQLGGNNTIRNNILTEIKDKLEHKGIDVDIDIEHGILRLNENSVRFSTGSDTLNKKQLSRLNTVANTLSEILPCYSNKQYNYCKKENKGKIDSIFIEGHTDNVPITGRLALKFKDNWVLSAHRAMYIYRELILQQPILSQIYNTNNQPIISVSGYGDGRPVPGHKHKKHKADPKNRRIDIRFIMTPPSIKNTQKELESNL